MPAFPGTLRSGRDELDAGRVSSVELVDAALGRAESSGAELNAFVGMRAERARAPQDTEHQDQEQSEGFGGLADKLRAAIRPHEQKSKKK